eukprot:m.101566 g.101566  ORF g.101566 m.101566 type:complete len:763 (+) comp13205_c0_seq1:287-2575(+)
MAARDISSSVPKRMPSQRRVTPQVQAPPSPTQQLDDLRRAAQDLQVEGEEQQQVVPGLDGEDDGELDPEMMEMFASLPDDVIQSLPEELRADVLLVRGKLNDLQRARDELAEMEERLAMLQYYKAHQDALQAEAEEEARAKGAIPAAVQEVDEEDEDESDGDEDGEGDEEDDDDGEDTGEEEGSEVEMTPEQAALLQKLEMLMGLEASLEAEAAAKTGEKSTAKATQDSQAMSPKIQEIKGDDAQDSTRVTAQQQELAAKQQRLQEILQQKRALEQERERLLQLKEKQDALRALQEQQSQLADLREQYEQLQSMRAMLEEQAAAAGDVEGEEEAFDEDDEDRQGEQENDGDEDFQQLPQEYRHYGRQPQVRFQEANALRRLGLAPSPTTETRSLAQYSTTSTRGGEGFDLDAVDDDKVAEDEAQVQQLLQELERQKALQAQLQQQMAFLEARQAGAARQGESDDGEDDDVQDSTAAADGMLGRLQALMQRVDNLRHMGNGVLRTTEFVRRTSANGVNGASDSGSDQSQDLPPTQVQDMDELRRNITHDRNYLLPGRISPRSGSVSVAQQTGYLESVASVPTEEDEVAGEHAALLEMLHAHDTDELPDPHQFQLLQELSTVRDRVQLLQAHLQDQRESMEQELGSASDDEVDGSYYNGQRYQGDEDDEARGINAMPDEQLISLQAAYNEERRREESHNLQLALQYSDALDPEERHEFFSLFFSRMRDGVSGAFVEAAQNFSLIMANLSLETEGVDRAVGPETR